LDTKVHQLALEELQKRLSAYERQYGMTSAECEQQFFNGQLGDSQEMIRWIHDYHSYKILLKDQKPHKTVGV